MEILVCLYTSVHRNETQRQSKASFLTAMKCYIAFPLMLVVLSQDLRLSHCIYFDILMYLCSLDSFCIVIGELHQL